MFFTVWDGVSLSDFATHRVGRHRGLGSGRRSAKPDLGHIDTRLHLGLHKTASTHLQNAIAQSRSLLTRERIAYLGPSDIRAGGSGVHEALHGASPTLVRRRLLRRLSGHNRVLISDENLIGTMEDNFLAEGTGIYRCAATRLGQLIDKMGFTNVRLFIALRNPADYYSSCYRFHIQKRSFVSWSDYSARHPLRDVSWVQLIRDLKDVPEVSHVTVWRFEDYPAIGRQVCAEMLGPQCADLSLDPGKANSGLPERRVRRKYEEAGIAPDFNGAVFRAFCPKARARSTTRYVREVARISGMAGVTVLKP